MLLPVLKKDEDKHLQKLVDADKRKYTKAVNDAEAKLKPFADEAKKAKKKVHDHP